MQQRNHIKCTTTIDLSIQSSYYLTVYKCLTFIVVKGFPYVISLLYAWEVTIKSYNYMRVHYSNLPIMCTLLTYSKYT